MFSRLWNSSLTCNNGPDNIIFLLSTFLVRSPASDPRSESRAGFQDKFHLTPDPDTERAESRNQTSIWPEESWSLVTGHPIVWAGERRWPLSAAPRVWLRLMLIGSPACGQTTFIFICRQEQKGWEFHSRENWMWNEIRITVPIPGMYLEFSRETYLCMQSLASLWFIFCTYLHNRVLDNTLYFSWMPRGRGAPYRTWPRRRGIWGTRYIFCDGPGLPSRLICPVKSVLHDILVVINVLLALETFVLGPGSQDSHTEAPNHPTH